MRSAVVQTFKKQLSRSRDQSLSVSLSFALIMTVMTISAITISIGYYNVYSESRERLNAKADEYISFLVNILKVAIWDMDNKSIQNIGRFYTQSDIVSHLEILSDSGNKLYQFSKKYDGDTVSRSQQIIHNGHYIGSVNLSLTSQLYTETINRYVVINVIVALFVSITLAMVTGLFLRKLLKQPLDSLIRGSERIAGGDYHYRFETLKYQEIKVLAAKFGHMAQQIEERETQLEDEIAEHKQTEQELTRYRDHLEELVQERTLELEATHRELVDTARQVGMAEVATGVLHNVGNVLNNVGVTTASIAKLIRTSKTTYLSNVVTLLEDHQDDLSSFMARDERGRRLPSFIAELSKQLSIEQGSLKDATDKLTGHIQHITEIISLQQTFGKVSGVYEPVLISDIVEDAVRINDVAIRRHCIELERHYAELPPGLFDRPKVLQILTNLLSNAKNALVNNDPQHKLITLRIIEPQADRVRIEVSDNGMGIEAGHLTRIFSYGFTTRPEGHGFGLHTSALAAKEMGGTLMAHSDGPGQGATFTLELPLQPPGLPVNKEGVGDVG